VQFYLHPTFANPVQTVPVRYGVARLDLKAWGSFTAGAVADEGKTRLELDLSTLKDAPKEFRER